MKRRAFLLGAFVFPLFTSLSAKLQPQPGKVYKIGFLRPGIDRGELAYRQARQAFWDELKQFGFTFGENVTEHRRYAEGRAERLPVLAAELVREHVDLRHIAYRDLDRPFLAREFVRCGRSNGRCRQGLRHGPYWYLRYQQRDRESRTYHYRREYVRHRKCAA
jgi:hypothetical protein